MPTLQPFSLKLKIHHDFDTLKQLLNHIFFYKLFWFNDKGNH